MEAIADELGKATLAEAWRAASEISESHIDAASKVSEDHKDASVFLMASAYEVFEVTMVSEVSASFASMDAMAATSINDWVSEDGVVHKVHAQGRSKV